MLWYVYKRKRKYGITYPRIQARSKSNPSVWYLLLIFETLPLNTLVIVNVGEVIKNNTQEKTACANKYVTTLRWYLPTAKLRTFILKSSLGSSFALLGCFEVHTADCFSGKSGVACMPSYKNCSSLVRLR
jgi:hypothetical protein